MYFANSVRDGSFGKFDHIREPASISTNQAIIRLNRYTLYFSLAVFDLDAGPVTITFFLTPECFMSILKCSL